MTASIKKLKESLLTNTQRTEYSAWLVVVGLILEIPTLFWFSVDKPESETALLIFSTFLITLGVYGEIRFGRKVAASSEELQRISDKKIAEANLETEKIKALVQWRAITPEMRNQLLSALAQTRYNIVVEYVDDPEAIYFAMQFVEIFKEAGWAVTRKQNTYFDTVFNLYITAPKNNATTLICKALAYAKIDFSTESVGHPKSSFTIASANEHTSNIDTTSIVIGSKPPAF
jgi:hypothetical protein